MLKFEQETELIKLARPFIEELNGRYISHASNKMIECLIVRAFRDPANVGDPRTRGEVLMDYAEMNEKGSERDSRCDALNSAYSAGCQVFESILEYGCGCHGNGHHVAQAFAAEMTRMADRNRNMLLESTR
jgi:hypothetical protein